MPIYQSCDGLQQTMKKLNIKVHIFWEGHKILWNLSVDLTVTT